jgi:hypothetical protein
MSDEENTTAIDPLEEIRQSDMVWVMLTQLATHYQVDPLEMKAALLNRQVKLAVMLTDFNKPGGQGALSRYLTQQNALEISLANRASAGIAKALDAIATAEKVHEEATRLLAKLRKEQSVKSKK